MIPRYQRILFWSLIGSILLMGAFLLRGCRQAHQRLTALNDATPIAAPTTSATEEVTLYLASDADATITPTRSEVALPQEPSLRARALLEHLLAQYALPASGHPLKSGPTVYDVFLLANPADAKAGQIAVVNLRGSFVDNHPSGVEAEQLTLNSIIGTLHAALPEVTEVRFLVDGQPHDTLAGHVALNRSYSLSDTTTRPTAPSEAATQP
ncbi:GerMN domain-containing protein [Edaphobacter aggregans]|uniref:GerMN domain-containing protein n=1 Tax=Edaphobacter aggregans TaxID=570835 RepID=UPI0005524736|nr:GerMN domain-containing protein [Edaphobacter aggregans]